MNKKEIEGCREVFQEMLGVNLERIEKNYDDAIFDACCMIARLLTQNAKLGAENENLRDKLKKGKQI